jgi:undecaprenyl-diphosphatase
MVEALILGVVQGITEFFPISSTAHLIVLPWFMKWGGELNSLTFDVALHAGTLAALLVCFRADIAQMFNKNRRLLFLIIIGTIPAAVSGVLWHDYIEGALRSPRVVAIMLVAFGFVMYLADRLRGRKDVKGMNILDAIFIGVAQAVALVPGVSRSGVTISAGLMMGIKRHEAARFSFLLSIPTLAGAALLEGRKLFDGPHDYNLTLFAVGSAASMLTGILAIKFLLKYLASHTLNVFVVYRFALSGLIIGGLWLRG